MESPDAGPPPDSSSSPADAPSLQYSRKRRTHPILLLLLGVVGAAMIAGGLWAAYYRDTTVPNTQANLNAAGFSTPVVNKLDPSFTDADGDLIADAPADPSKLIDPPTITFCFVAND